MSIVVDRPVSDALLERIQNHTAERMRLVYELVAAYAESAAPDAWEKRKCVESGLTLSPHEHRRQKQLVKCDSVSVVQIRPEDRKYWPVHRSVIRVYTCINERERLELFVSEGKLRQVKRLQWDDLCRPDHHDVLSELEYLFAPSLALRRKR